MGGMRMKRIYIIPLSLVLAVAFNSGCVTPSIPIPPPSPERMEFNVDLTGGTARFAYPPTAIYAESTVYVYNRDRGVGVITTSQLDGRVAPTEPFAAMLGDQVVVTFERDQQAVSTCIRLRNGAQSATDACE